MGSFFSSTKEAFVRVDSLEAEAARSKKLLGRLKAAILSQAVKGQLVPKNHSNDEPATALLARIRAQRSATETAKQSNRGIKRHPKQTPSLGLFDNHDDDDGPSTLLSFYTAPRGTIPQGWRATPESFAALRPTLQPIDSLSFNGKSSQNGLEVLRKTPLKPLIPAPSKPGAISAARLSKKATANLSGALQAGPWAAFSGFEDAPAFRQGLLLIECCHGLYLLADARKRRTVR